MHVTEEFMDKLVLGVAALALSAGAASAQVVYPGYGYAPYGYGYGLCIPKTLSVLMGEGIA
jgi:hypothetical protein